MIIPRWSSLCAIRQYPVSDCAQNYGCCYTQYTTIVTSGVGDTVKLATAQAKQPASPGPERQPRGQVLAWIHSERPAIVPNVNRSGKLYHGRDRHAWHGRDAVPNVNRSGKLYQQGTLALRGVKPTVPNVNRSGKRYHTSGKRSPPP